MSLIRSPTETDPLMTQSQRTDFPPELERQVVDGGVKEGRPEIGAGIGLLWLLAILIAFLLIVGLAVNWSRLFP